MGQYVQFFIKVNGVYAPIGIFHYNSVIGEAFGRYSYGKVAPLDVSYLNDQLDEAKARQTSITAHLQKIDKEIGFMKEIEASFEEKLEYWEGAMGEKEYYKEELEKIEGLINWIGFIFTIIEEGEDEVKYGDNFANIESGKYVWVGTEPEF